MQSLELEPDPDTSATYEECKLFKLDKQEYIHAQVPLEAIYKISAQKLTVVNKR